MNLEHWNPSRLAHSLGVPMRTARRWVAAGALPAPWALLAGAIDDLGTIDPAWRRWKLHRGQLVSPEGWTFRPGEVIALPALNGLVRALEAERARPAQYVLI